MNRQKINSSNIDSVGYENNSSVLEIEFVDGGIYQYFDVPLELFQGLLNASSAGRYLNEKIKDRYLYKEI